MYKKNVSKKNYSSESHSQLYQMILKSVLLKNLEHSSSFLPPQERSLSGFGTAGFEMLHLGLFASGALSSRIPVPRPVSGGGGSSLRLEQLTWTQKQKHLYADVCNLLLATKYKMRDLMDDMDNWDLYEFEKGDSKKAEQDRWTKRGRMFSNFWAMCGRTFEQMVAAFGTEKCAERAEEALERGERVVVCVFNTGADQRHEGWSMFGKKGVVKNGKPLKSLLGGDHVGHRDLVREGHRAAPASEENDGEEYREDVAGEDGSSAAGAGKVSGSAKGASARGASGEENKVDPNDVQAPGVEDVQAPKQNGKTLTRKSRYFQLMTKLKTVRYDPETGKPLRPDWRKNNLVAHHEIVPSIVLQNICEALSNYQVDNSVPKPTSLLRAANQTDQDAIADLVELWKCLPLAELCPSGIDYVQDRFGGPSKVALISGKTAHFSRCSYDKDSEDFHKLRYDQWNGEKRDSSKLEELAAFASGVKKVCLVTPNMKSLRLNITPDALEEDLRRFVSAGEKAKSGLSTAGSELVLEQLGRYKQERMAVAKEGESSPGKICFVMMQTGTASEVVEKLYAACGRDVASAVAFSSADEIAAANKPQSILAQRARCGAAVAVGNRAAGANSSAAGLFDKEDWNTPQANRAAVEMVREILARPKESGTSGGHWSKNKNKVQDYPGTWSNQLLNLGGKVGFVIVKNSSHTWSIFFCYVESGREGRFVLMIIFSRGLLTAG